MFLQILQKTEQLVLLGAPHLPTLTREPKGRHRHQPGGRQRGPAAWEWPRGCLSRAKAIKITWLEKYLNH